MAYLSPTEFAASGDTGRGELREAPSSSIGAGWGAGKANWQAGLGALAGALGFDTEDFVRNKQDEAAFYQRNAPGATSFFGEGGVTDGGTVADWIAYNFGQSAPYMLEMLGGAGVGSLALKTARGAAVAKAATELAGQGAVRTQAARALGPSTISGAAERGALEAASKDVASRYAMGAGGALASYPSAVGDILTNQLEAGASFDDMNLGAAAAGGIPYAALNLLGGEAAIGRALTGGAVRKAGVDAASEGVLNTGLDFLKATAKGQNFPGSLLHGGAKAGVMEGVGETGQEVINQALGRMAVNPNEGLFTGDAPMRYAESFMAGLGMGGVTGGGAAVFAKPTAETPDAIATRADTLSRSLEQINAGNETWRETLDRGREEEAQYQKDLEADKNDAYEADFKVLQDEDNAKVEQSKKLAEIVTAFEKMKQQKLKTELSSADLKRKLTGTATDEAPQMDWVEAITGEKSDPWAGVDTGPDANTQQERPYTSPSENRMLVPREVADIGGLFDLANLPPVQKAAPAPQQTTKQESTFDPLAEFAGRPRAERRAPMSALAQKERADAEAKAQQEEQAWGEMNSDPRYGMVQDMFGRAPDYPNTTKVEEEVAPVEEDTNTINMFSMREGETKPRVTPAAKKATGNWFRNPPQKATQEEVQSAFQIISDLPMAAFAHLMADITGDRNTVEQVATLRELSPELKSKMVSAAITSRARASAAAPQVQQEFNFTPDQVDAIATDKLVELVTKFNNRRKAPKPKETQNGKPSETPAATEVVKADEAIKADEANIPVREEVGKDEVAQPIRKETEEVVRELVLKGEMLKVEREWNQNYAEQADGTTFRFQQLSKDKRRAWKDAVDNRRATQEFADSLVAEENEVVAPEPAPTPEPVVEAPAPSEAEEALRTISELPGRTLSSKKAQVQVELEIAGTFSGSMSPVQAVEFTNEKISAYEAMIKACLGG